MGCMADSTGRADRDLDRDIDRGQIDTSAAEVYDGFFVPALFGRFAEAVADAAAVGPSDDVVDVACGSGALTRALRARTGGRVVGVDLNPAMLAVARRRGGDIDYVEGDGQDLPLDDGEFDVAACQFGLMFLPDPARGVAELVRVGRRGTVAVWDAIEASEGYVTMRELFDAELGVEAARSLDAPFALGRPGVLEALFDGTGVHVSFRRVEGTGRFASVEEWVTTEVRGWTLGESVSDERLADLVAVASAPDRLGRFAGADGCVFPMAAKIATWAPPGS
jgi:SAM-dependent methyltransferase